jgi:glycosyltransferase involved in cell wall biosynthesis
MSRPGPSGELSVTFVTPHQRRNSGGVYTIQQFARHWPWRQRVQLVVRKGPTTPLDGMEVMTFDAAARSLPATDLIIVPADDGGVDEARSLSPGAHALLFFQGYGAIRNPVVERNLASGHDVLAGSGWLASAARASGCPTRLIRYGLDRTVFNADGRSMRPSGMPPTVGMMTSPTAWKGSSDGLEAIGQAATAIPGLQVKLFGKSPAPDTPWSFLAAPPAARSDIASLMRECDVFVCSSWEEGFGLPGLEAGVCGAALATTDTKGSRDYAVHERTALVSPPHDPAALAANIVRLVHEDTTRARLVANGHKTAADLCPDWPTAAAEFARCAAALAGG